MIYLKDGNIPLNLAYDDDIVQEANSTYQLSFKFPLTDGKWNLLRQEVFLLADDLHGEQEFFIFEAKKSNGYVQVYAKQVATLLNYYSINSISVDRVPGQTAMTALAGSVKRPCPFTFFSDILDRHTFNESNVSVMDALAKEKHSIVGQWGGDLVRDKYQVKLLKNGGIENESLFMYKKNLSNYEESENINNLKTRLHLKKIIQGQSEAEEDRVLAVTVDSPLISQYSQIYEADIEVDDQDVTDEASLLSYGQRYFSSTLCDLVENSINLDVKGKSDVAVKMFDTVSVFHERFDVDLRLKITSYHFAPMSKRLKSIGFGKVSQSFGSTVANMVAGSVDKATGKLSASFERKLQKEIDNANRHFDAEFEKRVEEINDGIEQAQAEAELYADTIKQNINAEIAQVNQFMQSQAEEHDRQVADILSKTQSVEALANQAKSDAASAIARANQVKTETIADARAQIATVNQALNTAKSELQTAIASADQKARDSQASATALRNDLNSQAAKILAQAQAQTALTNRVTTVETLADGTRSTVAELSKTVIKATGDIASVASRTKTVEDTLSQTRTQYEALTQTINAQTGQIDSINRKTADLQSGLDGVTERFESLRIEDNLLLNSSFNNDLDEWSGVGVTIVNGKGRITGELNRTKRTYQSIKIQTATDDIDQTYIASILVKVTDFEAGPTNPFFAFYVSGKKNDSLNTWFGVRYLTTNLINRVNNQGWVRFSTTFKVPVPREQIKTLDFEIYARDFTGEVEFEKVSLRRGNVDLGWQASPEDLRSEIATYKRTAEESSSALSRQIQLADGKAVEAKSYAQQTATGFNTRIEDLESYKNAEGARASQYLTASREETARQLEAERTSISANYVAKSTYTEDVRGTTQRLNEIKTTADTAKQNLATYQNTVDRKLSELTTSTQTLDGKVNTASAKVDTVAGQIRTEISEVEGKIPTALGGRNYILKSDVYATSGSRYFDTSPEFIDYAYGGRYVTISLDIKGENLVPDARGLSRIGCELRLNLSDGKVLYLQCQKIVSGTQPRERISVTKQIPQGVSVVSANKVSMYIQVGGTALAGRPKFELSSIPSDWSPAPEDINAEINSTKTLITQTAEGQTQLSNRLTTTQDKVTTAETSIRQLINDVSSKVSQTDHDTLTGRMTSAETAITQNAQEISRRLTSTQVESAITAKGYQTKSDVDNNIAGRGYITNSALQPYALSTTVQNLVTDTADSFSRSITETRALIPSGESNLVKWGRPGETSEYANASLTNHTFFYNGNIKMYVIRNLSTSAEKIVGLNRFKVERNTDYTLYFKGFNNSTLISMDVWFLKRTRGSSADFDEAQRLVNRKLPFLGVEDVVVTFNTGNFDEGYIRFDNNGSTTEGRSADLYFGDVSVKKGRSNNGWSPSVEELATVTALNSVKDTVDSHTRTIGAVGTAGSILDNVSKVTQTANGLVTEVSGANGLKTQVSQLAGSWAVQLSGPAGLKTAINASDDGIRLLGRNIRIDGNALIDNAVITSAMIASLDAGKITTGYLAAARIATNSIDGSKLVFDQAFVNKMTANEALFKQLFAKNAFITSVQAVTLSASQITSGVMRATNGAMEINLNAGQILYYTDQAALKRVLSGYPTQFVKFATGTVTGKGTAGVTVIGSNRWNSESSNDGGFVGIRAWNGSNIDQIDVVGDTVRLASSTFESADGWTVNTLPGKLDIDAFNADHRASSKIKVGDLWLWKNATTYSSMRDTINLIIDNLQLLHNNKSTERAYSYTLPAKV
ncbi:TPA: phage tail spike protein [Streptococcus suis]